jgi:hypothetical protein
MFIQVVSTAFLTVIRNYDKWKDLSNITQPPLYGMRHMDPPQELNVDRAAIEKQSRDSFAGSQALLEQNLSPELYNELSAMFNGGSIDISKEQWVTAVFDMIAAFRDASDKIALVESLKGLYFGRALSFMNKTWDLSTEEAEKEIIAGAEIFHAKRGYLIDKLEG